MRMHRWPKAAATMLVARDDAESEGRLSEMRPDMHAVVRPMIIGASPRRSDGLDLTKASSSIFWLGEGLELEDDLPSIRLWSTSA